MADDIGEAVKRRFEEAGYSVVDAQTLFDGIDKLYRKPSVEDVIEEELPRILSADPQFFLRNQINLAVVTERLNDLYANEPEIKEKYDSPVNRVSHSFKVWLRHIRYFMVDHPDNDELGNAIDELKKILDGRFLEDNDGSTEHMVHTEAVRPNSIEIPNIYDVREEHYPIFISYGCVQDEVKGILPFIAESEARKVTMRIMSAGEDPSTRALSAKEIFERYLNEARSLVVNPDKLIPMFYDKESEVYQVIERARNAILV